jgi:uncharacterized protein YceK
MRVSLLLLSCLCSTQSGCATIVTLSPDRVEGAMYESSALPRSFPRLFSGVLADGYCLGKDGSGQVWLFCLLDIPLSLAADIVASPYTAYQQVVHGNYHPRCVVAQREEIRSRNRKNIQDALDLCRKDQARGIYNCPSMIAPDGTVLLAPFDGGPPCPETH